MDECKRDQNKLLDINWTSRPEDPTPAQWSYLPEHTSHSAGGCRNKNNVVGFDFYPIQPNPSNHARHAEGAEVNRKQKFSRSENTLLVGLKQIMG